MRPSTMTALSGALLMLLPMSAHSARLDARNGRSATNERRQAVMLLGAAAPTNPFQRLVSVVRGGAKEEHTYAMLKPDVASDDQAVDAIKQQIESSGLRIVREERCRLSKGDCEAFYAEHKERPFFPALVKFMSSAPVLKMELAGPDAIKRWRAILGPTNSATARDEAPDSIRAKFGKDNQLNAAHGSDAPSAAARELALMFKD
jgi:nucleoside diphosphate kinase